jgi:hypothetical protein
MEKSNSMKGSQGKPKSSIESGTERKSAVAYCGGMPSEKSIKEINKANSPEGRSKAPGSVRV